MTRDRFRRTENAGKANKTRLLTDGTFSTAVLLADSAVNFALYNNDARYCRDRRGGALLTRKPETFPAPRRVRVGKFTRLKFSLSRIQQS